MISQQILDAMLQLPETDRLLIASRLLETLPDPVATGDLNEDDFTTELERRSNDWQDAVSWEELKATMQTLK